MKKLLLVGAALVLVIGAIVALGFRSDNGGDGGLLGIAEARGLSPEDAAHAVKTFVPPGGRDEYLLFASGGHSGQVHVVGVPSMRLLKTIAVFTPEPWQGYGYGADWSEASLDDARGAGPMVRGPNDPDEPLRWGDSHHPALSECLGGAFLR